MGEVLEENFDWHCKALIRHFGRYPRSPGRIKPLLFAPRLMLERGLQSPGAVRASPNDARSPLFFARLRLRKQPDEAGTSRLILPRTINA